MAVTAADAIAARLTGRSPRAHRFRYLPQHVSLGPRDGLCQFVRPDETPRRSYLTGRPAGWVKELFVGLATLRSLRLTGPCSFERRRSLAEPG